MEYYHIPEFRYISDKMQSGNNYDSLRKYTQNIILKRKENITNTLAPHIITGQEKARGLNSFFQKRGFSGTASLKMDENNNNNLPSNEDNELKEQKLQELNAKASNVISATLDLNRVSGDLIGKCIARKSSDKEIGIAIKEQSRKLDRVSIPIIQRLCNAQSIIVSGMLDINQLKNISEDSEKMGSEIKLRTEKMADMAIGSYRIYNQYKAQLDQSIDKTKVGIENRENDNSVLREGIKEYNNLFNTSSSNQDSSNQDSSNPEPPKDRRMDLKFICGDTNANSSVSNSVPNTGVASASGSRTLVGGPSPTGDPRFASLEKESFSNNSSKSMSTDTNSNSPFDNINGFATKLTFKQILFGRNPNVEGDTPINFVLDKLDLEPFNFLDDGE